MRVLIATMFVALLGGCAPDPTKPGAEPVDGATAEEAGGQMASSIESGAGGFRRTNQPGFAMAVGSAGEGELVPDFCLHLVEGAVWTDIDGDGNPSPAVDVDISCSFTSPDGDVVASGAIVFGDTDPAAAGFDASIEFNDLDVLVTGTASKYHISGDASDVNSGVALGAGSFELTHHEDGTNNTQSLGLDDTLYGEIDEHYVWDMVLTVTGFQPGNDAPAGTMSVSGEWNVAVHNYFEDIEQGSGTTVETVVPLQLDPACATNITGGQVAATFDGDDGQAFITVTWTGCGTYDVEFVGSSG